LTIRAFSSYASILAVGSGPWGVRGGVILIAGLRYGLSAPLLVIGLVLAAGFGGLALLGPFMQRRTRVD